MIVTILYAVHVQHSPSLSPRPTPVRSSDLSSHTSLEVQLKTKFRDRLERRQLFIDNTYITFRTTVPLLSSEIPLPSDIGLEPHVSYE